MWIKFCGIVRPEDLAQAVALGVDAVGIIAVPGSPRCLSDEQAEELSDVPRRAAQLTLVLQDPTVEYASQMISSVKPDLLQFHGKESPEFASQFGLPYIKATRDLSEAALMALKKHRSALAWLLDSPEAIRKEELVSDLMASHLDQRIIVAGGLSVAKVAHIIKNLQPWGVDVSRGIERSPGEKDCQLMQEFVDAVRA